MYHAGSKSHSFGPLVAIAALLIGTNVWTFTEVDGELDSGWVDVLSDPYYEQDIEECDSAGTSTGWCFKDWNCPTEEGHCIGLANKPGVMITNSKTLDKFPLFFDGPKIAYKGILQGCSANLECSAGYSDKKGFDIPVSKILEFSEQYPPEIMITLSKLYLGGLGTRHGILTDLWFIDQESKALLVIDIYWQRSEPILFPPFVVLEEDWSGVKYKVYHYWEEPNCLAIISDHNQSCTLPVSSLLTNASDATYNVVKCIRPECATLDTDQGSFDYSKFILQDIDSGVELLMSPWGEASATITYTQLKYWSLYNEGSQSKTAISVRMERGSYSADDDISIVGNVDPVIPGQKLQIRIVDPTGVLVRTDNVYVASSGEFMYTFPAGQSAMRLDGEYEAIAMYEGATDFTTFDYITGKANDEEIPRPSLEISNLKVIRPTDGVVLVQLEARQDAVISTTFRNPQTVSQSYTLVAQITDENSITIDIFLEPGIVGAESTVNLQLPWSAVSPGTYKIQVLMVDDLESPSLLSESSALIIPVS